MKRRKAIIFAGICGLMVSCGGYFQPTQQTGAGKAPQLSKCERDSFIDDFEDADNQILLREGRGEYIYTYKDGLGTEIEFPKDGFRAYPGGVGDSKFAIRFRGHTAKEGGDIYAGIGFGLSADGPAAPYDASKYTGVSFLARRASKDAVNVVRFNIADVNTDPRGNVCTECFNHFGAPIKLTDEWVRYVVFFDEMTQRAGWGDPRPEKIDVSGLLGMQFQFSVPNAKFDVMIDDIRFVGACGEKWAERPSDDEQAAQEPAPKPAEPAAAPEQPAEPEQDTAAGGDTDAASADSQADTASAGEGANEATAQ